MHSNIFKLLAIVGALLLVQPRHVAASIHVNNSPRSIHNVLILDSASSPLPNGISGSTSVANFNQILDYSITSGEDSMQATVSQDSTIPTTSSPGDSIFGSGITEFNFSLPVPATTFTQDITNTCTVNFTVPTTQDYLFTATSFDAGVFSPSVRSVTVISLTDASASTDLVDLGGTGIGANYQGTVNLLAGDIYSIFAGSTLLDSSKTLSVSGSDSWSFRLEPVPEPCTLALLALGSLGLLAAQQPLRKKRKTVPQNLWIKQQL